MVFPHRPCEHRRGIGLLLLLAFIECSAKNELQKDPRPAPAPAASEACGAADPAKEVTVRQIINIASGVAALADGGLAQIPGAGPLLLPGIQAGMVAAIGHHYGCHLDLGHALAFVTGLASSTVKDRFVKEALSFIPFVGNIAKASAGFVMTQSIGVAADGVLKCPARTKMELEDLLGSGTGVANQTSTMQRLFHVVVDYLNDLEVSSAEDVFDRVKELFFSPDRAGLLAKVHSAADDAEALNKLLRRHVLNLEVVPAILARLVQNHEVAKGCVGMDLVARKLWTPLAASQDARSAAAPFLLDCLHEASISTRATIGDGAGRALLSSRSRYGKPLPPDLMRAVLQLLEIIFEDGLPAEGDEGAETNATARLAVAPWWAKPHEFQAVMAAVFHALGRGEEAACNALRTLLRAEPASQLRRWVTFSALQRLRQSTAPPGAEFCVAALSQDFEAAMLLDALPDPLVMPRLTPAAASTAEQSKLAALPGVVGQNCTMRRLLGHTKLKQKELAGLWPRDAPLVLLLTGPSGTGKTMTARVLAERLLGKPVRELEAAGRFRTFHMNQFSSPEDQKSFFGPPRGIVGKGDLPELFRQAPDAVVILDEIEKADPSFARALLKVFGENGAVYDPHTGREFPTVQGTFILTSNLAKDFIMTRQAELVEMDGEDLDCAGYAQLHKAVAELFKQPHIGGHSNFFRESEIRGRLADILPFLPFSPQEIAKAVRAFLDEEALMISKSRAFRHNILAWDAAVAGLLAEEYQHRPEEGLRGVHKRLQTSVRQLLEAALDVELLEDYGGVVLRALPPEAGGTAEGRLDLRLLSAQGMRDWRRRENVPFEDPRPPPPPAPPQTSAGGTPSPPGMTSVDGASSPEGAAAAGGGLFAWAYELKREVQRDWDWNLLWQQLMEYLYEYRLHLLASALFIAAIATPVIAPSLASGVPSMAAAASNVASTAAAAPSAAASAGAAVAGLSSLLSLAINAGMIAVPVLALWYFGDMKALFKAWYPLLLLALWVMRLAWMTARAGWSCPGWVSSSCAGHNEAHRSGVPERHCAQQAREDTAIVRPETQSRDPTTPPPSLPQPAAHVPRVEAPTDGAAAEGSGSPSGAPALVASPSPAAGHSSVGAGQSSANGWSSADGKSSIADQSSAEGKRAAEGQLPASQRLSEID